MKNKLRTFLAATIVLSTLAFAQDKNSEKAKKDFDQYAYSKAIEKYETLVEKGYTEEQIYKNLGDANYANANYKEAADWYGKLFSLETANVDTDYMYRYAQTLKSTKDYKAADQWLAKFRASNSADVRAIKAADNLDYLNEIEENSGRYDIKNLAINSAASDFAPSMNGEKLVFATARDSGKVARRIHDWTNQPFLNLYSANPDETDFSAVNKLDQNANKKTHESSAVFTKDGKTVYFTRNNSQNGNFSRDDKGVSRLKIYRAKVNEDNWSDIIELPFNGDDYSCAHPALSPDESKLYFASDMPGTVGESDIFSANINSDGSIGAPVNSGNVINTEARETFPFISSDNILYFASDGHPGLGGLDVFATSIEDMGNLNILNIGKPINTEQDDFSYIVDKETNKGYFASNREGGKGSDDIYSFTENEPLDFNCYSLVAGRVIDEETKEPIGMAKVSIFDAADKLISSIDTAADGSYEMSIECTEGNFNVVAMKQDYLKNNKNFTVVKSKDTGDVIVSLEKELKKAPVGTDLAKFLNIEPVYFDYDKWFIRPDAKISMEKILTYFKEYPNTKIQIGSHTDSRASKAYNIRLSDKRANATMEYLVQKGVAAENLKALGFGETMLTNECFNNVKCDDQKHQENRRSEFIILEQ